MADGGTMQAIAQAGVREKMAKGRMEVRQRATEIGVRVAKEIGTRVAKDGAAKVGETETEVKSGHLNEKGKGQ